MKKVIKYIAAVMFLTLASACSSDDATTGADMGFEKNIDGVPVLCGTEGSAPYAAMLTADGELKGKFDAMPGFSVNGIFAVCVSYLDTDRDRVTHPKREVRVALYKLSDCKPIEGAVFKRAGYYSDGLIPVITEDDEYAVVDKKGETKFLMREAVGKEIEKCGTFYSDGLLKVKGQNGKWGYIDKKGEVIVPFKYDNTMWYMYGYTIVWNLKNKKYRWVL